MESKELQQPFKLSAYAALDNYEIYMSIKGWTLYEYIPHEHFSYMLLITLTIKSLGYALFY